MGMPSVNRLSLLFLYFFLFLSLLASMPSSSLAVAETHRDYPTLQAFRTSADPGGSFLSSWAPDSDPCSGTWAGVACRGGRVTRVLLPGRDLRGPLDALTLLPHLRLLNLSRNRLTGGVPSGLLRLRRLRRLDLSGNLLSGRIPPEVGTLPRLVTLRLEGNLLGGGIPPSLGSMAGLADFNVSGNGLSGRIPGSLSSFPVSSFAGNGGLCGRPLLRQCRNQTASRDHPTDTTRKYRRKKRDWKVVAGVAVGAVLAATTTLVVVLLVLCCRRKRRREATTEERGHGGAKGAGVGEVAEQRKGVVSFEGCRGFTVEELMRGSAEMLGRGAVGTTYRVVMEGDEGRGMAVKRVRRSGQKPTGKGRDEHGAAGKGVEWLLGEIAGLRHPNVAMLRAYYQADDELLLVYDYLPNGSLHSLLHGNRGPGRTPLGWTARLKLALGAAEGLAYLHGASKSKLVHHHLTSSNVLVDDDGNARISDFALHHLPGTPPPEGYPSTTAPELLVDASNSTRGATQKADVYSFGVLLLEMLTGREAGEGEAELAKWVQTVVREEWTSEVFDVELLTQKEVEDEMVALLQVALLCLAPLPRDRPDMSMVFKMIEGIKERGSQRGGVSTSPSSSLLGSSHGSSTLTASEGTPNFPSS